MKSAFRPSNIAKGTNSLKLLTKRYYVSKSSSLVTIFNSKPGPQLRLNFKKTTVSCGFFEYFNSFLKTLTCIKLDYYPRVCLGLKNSEHLMAFTC